MSSTDDRLNKLVSIIRRNIIFPIDRYIMYYSLQKYKNDEIDSTDLLNTFKKRMSRSILFPSEISKCIELIKQLPVNYTAIHSAMFGP